MISFFQCYVFLVALVKSLPDNFDLKVLVPTKGCLISPTFNRGGFVLIRPTSLSFNKAANSTQRFGSNTSATLMFLVFFLSCPTYSKVHLSKSRRPSAKNYPTKSHMQSNPNLSKLNHPTKVLSAKDKLPDVIIFPPVATAPSMNTWKLSSKTTILLA